jgi:hypothetical protein
MANIYEEKSEPLHILLDRSRSDDGATILIPDLQRPYVWTPNQVSLLVDTLIRGWPFGTLLMWKVGQGQLQSIPHRQFWRLVDHTDDANGSVVIRKDPPAAYHMVLDGQQRIQSLLLSLGGDAWGFKLEDRDWTRELQDRRPRGPQGKHRHWSKASLCFDLKQFLAEYTAGTNLVAVDFRNVLQWVITDPTDGQSTWSKSVNYEEPLERSFEEKNKGRFIRLSRLWSAATPNPNMKEAHFRETLKELFSAEGVPSDIAESLLVPMGELMTTLRDVKLSKVTYLELLPFDKQVWTEDSYNDAIVNIFTRLNTAGRTLTREEITLAWLKVGWDEVATGGKTAGQCFLDLQTEVADRSLDIEMDSLVSAVSFIWSVCCNQGQLLANRDLLRGATIRPMASELAKRWTDIRRAVLAGLDAVKSRELKYGAGDQYSSLNALAVVWAWIYLAFQWEAEHALTVPERDDFEKKVAATLSTVLDRWLICSQWAGRWGGSSATIVAGYAKALYEEALACAKVDSLQIVHNGLSDRFETFIKELETDAANFVNTLAASSRERVSVYRTALWVWHRLDDTRWNMSSIPLRIGKGKESLDVDHAVAYAHWDKKLAVGLPTGIETKVEALALVNMLGNCSLLAKSFNISKSDKSLRSFMEQVHEFKEGKVELSSWALALQLENPMLDGTRNTSDQSGSALPDGTPASSDEIVAAIKKRDTAIRIELVEFVKGTKTRMDL